MKYNIQDINDPEMLIILAQKAMENAQELYYESKLLFRKKKYSRAIFLAQIGGEEIGKYLLCLTDYSKFRAKRFNIKTFLGKFYNHKEKTKLVNLIEDIFLDQDIRTPNELAIEANILENAKFMGLYSDIIENYIFKPSDICREDIAENAINWLGNRIRLFKNIFKESLFQNSQND